MKKSYDVRKLCIDEVKQIDVMDNMETTFKLWLKSFQDNVKKEPTLLDVFYAGYILSNPNVREKLNFYKGEPYEKNELLCNNAFDRF